MIDGILVVLLVLAALATVMTGRLIRSAVALAVTSAVLAVIMFRLNSPLAAVFELSVCAGLIPAIFISVISLTRRLGPEDLKLRQKDHLKRYWFLPILVVVAAVVLSQVSFPTDVIKPATTPEPDVRIMLWSFRHVDILGMVIILLGGAFAVVALLKEFRDDK